MSLYQKIVSISVYILVIELCCVLGIEVNSSTDTDENRIIRPTGYIYRQFTNHQPEIIYFSDQTTYKVETASDSKLTTQPTKRLNKSRNVSESNESIESNERNESDESSSSSESKETSTSTESAKRQIPKVNRGTPNINEFRDTAKEYFEQKKSNSRPIKTTESPVTPKSHAPKSHAPKRPNKRGGYETYEPQSEEDLEQQPNHQQPHPYGFIYQTPPTKGMASNYRPRPNAPIIFGNPFNFRWPIYRKIHVVPVPRKPLPPTHKPPPNHKPPPTQKPKMKHQPPKENQPPKKHEPPKKHDTPKKHEPPKKPHKKSKGEEDEEEKKEKEQEYESEEDDHSENESKGSAGDEGSSESGENSNYSEHESHEKKVKKKFEDKDDTEEEGGRRGHKSNKKDDKGGHNSHESGFHKVSGVKFNNENRKRKGFKTDKGYKNLDTFGKGKKKDYDEEQHADFHDKNHDKKATEHDASDKYGKHHDGYRGDKGGKFNEQKLHKKGAKTTGYHNTFHKDEYKKVHTFYDDADHRGHFKKFGSKHEQNDSDNGSSEDHEHHDSGHESEEQAQSGKLKKGHQSDEDENWSSKRSRNKGYSENDEYSKEDGYKKKNQKGYKWK